MENPLVSVIIPTYNRATLVREAIHSVVNQSYKNFEILVVDDGSSDNTKGIVQDIAKKDLRIKYIWQKHSGTPAVTRNRGIKASIGDLIAFLDSDDIWFSKKLEKQIKAFQRNPKMLVIASNSVYFSKEKKIIPTILFLNEVKLSFRNILRMNPLSISDVLVKREIFDSIGYFNESIVKMVDYEFWLRLLSQKDSSILIIKDILSKIRLHDVQLTTNRSFLEKYKLWKDFFKNYINYDQTYIEQMLRLRIIRHLFLKLETEILEKKVSFLSIINHKHLNIKQRAVLIVEFLIEKFYKKKNVIFNLLVNFFHFYIIKYLKVRQIYNDPNMP
ncbi:MAG: glycosyltransferase family 2 protein [Candidatus Odinarchaeota archaeon]